MMTLIIDDDSEEAARMGAGSMALRAACAAGVCGYGCTAQSAVAVMGEGWDMCGVLVMIVITSVCKRSWGCSSWLPWAATAWGSSRCLEQQQPVRGCEDSWLACGCSLWLQRAAAA